MDIKEPCMLLHSFLNKYLLHYVGFYLLQVKWRRFSKRQSKLQEIRQSSADAMVIKFIQWNVD